MPDVMLAIDTCTRMISLALRDSRRLLSESAWPSDRQHTAAVAARIQSALREAGVRPSDVGAVAVALGPGSFTGVRCGLALAKGMAMAGGVALVGASAFDIVAAAQPRLGLPMIVVVEAGRARLAAQRYEPNGDEFRSVGEWTLTTWADLTVSLAEPTWVCGDVPGDAPQAAAAAPNLRLAPAPLNVRRSGFLAELGYARWRAGDVAELATLAPIYPHVNAG